MLFVDVVRWMDIAAALDMERLREIMTELSERLAAVVRRYGGTAYQDLRDRYRTMVASLGFEGHIKWAEAMP